MRSTGAKALVATIISRRKIRDLIENWNHEDHGVLNRFLCLDSSEPDYERKLSKKLTQKKCRMGMEPEDIVKLFRFQQEQCAICRKTRRDLKSKDGKPWVIDHPAGGECLPARGILCQHCNRALGAFGDDVGRLQRAIEYLKDPTAQKCPGIEPGPVPYETGRKGEREIPPDKGRRIITRLEEGIPERKIAEQEGVEVHQVQKIKRGYIAR
jgi:hypothetical protein